MGRKPTKPIEVTIKIRDGRIASADGVLMLDAIMYHAWFAKHAPQVLQGMGDERYDGQIGLPLQQLTGNRWAASRAVYEETGKTVEYYNKRFDFLAADKVKYLDQKKGVIDAGAGKFRAYRNPIVIRTVKDGILKFYCKGHSDAILDMLSYIPVIGKKGSMGWGIIQDVSVKLTEQDYSLFHPEYGLMRPLPVSEAGEYDFDFSKYPILRYGVKPPYWKTPPELCYVPITN